MMLGDGGEGRFGACGCGRRHGWWLVNVASFEKARERIRVIGIWTEDAADDDETPMLSGREVKKLEEEKAGDV